MREICGGLAASEGKLRHLGLPTAPARSTLAYANEHLPWQLQQTIFEQRYEASGDGVTVVYDSDPTKPIGRWKEEEAWESAKIRGAVSCRFHDLRHTGCTRMLEAGVPFSVVTTIMGWSASTTVRMSRRYGHIGQSSQRRSERSK